LISSFVANRTARSMISYWHNVVCPPVCLWRYTKRYIL